MLRVARTCRLGLAVTAATALTLFGCSADSGTGAPDSEAVPEVTISLPDLSTTPVELRLAQPEPAGAPAATPELAVEQFVAAEIAGDHAASWGLLDGDSRATAGTIAEWARQHARLPRLTSFSTASRDVADATAVRVMGDATFVPQLDEVIGLVAADASITWQATAEDGGWRIAYSSTRVEPRWLDDRTAAEAVQVWARARQRCEVVDGSEHRGGLVGVPAIAERLCSTSEPVRAASPQPLADQPDPSAVIAAFGPEADLWARTVEISGPVSAHVVLAPLGDRWVVVGLLV